MSPANPDHDAEYQRRLQVEAQRWSQLDAERAQRINWLRSPLVGRHINTMVTGDPDKPWPEAAMERFLPTHRHGGRGLSLGCNDAGLERKAANELRRRIPRELLRLPSGGSAGDVAVPSLEWMRQTDPFEAIRSDEIMPIVRDTFRVLVQRDYGGTALHLALQDVLANFDESNDEHTALLQSLCDQERQWLSSGALPSDFTIVIAARKDAELGDFGA